MFRPSITLRPLAPSPTVAKNGQSKRPAQVTARRHFGSRISLFQRLAAPFPADLAGIACRVRAARTASRKPARMRRGRKDRFNGPSSRPAPSRKPRLDKARSSSLPPLGPQPSNDVIAATRIASGPQAGDRSLCGVLDRRAGRRRRRWPPCLRRDMAFFIKSSYHIFRYTERKKWRS
jgi:hypothetical protein